MKLGITIALINVNQRSKTLLHSFMISRAKFIIVGEGNLFSCTPDLGVINIIEAQTKHEISTAAERHSLISTSQLLYF